MNESKFWVIDSGRPVGEIEPRFVGVFLADSEGEAFADAEALGMEFGSESEPWIWAFVKSFESDDEFLAYAEAVNFAAYRAGRSTKIVGRYGGAVESVMDSGNALAPGEVPSYGY